MLGADVVCQSKIPLGLGHVASIKVQRRETIIAWKELLRLVRDEDGTVVKMYWATYPFTRQPQTFGQPPA